MKQRPSPPAVVKVAFCGAEDVEVFDSDVKSEMSSDSITVSDSAIASFIGEEY